MKRALLLVLSGALALMLVGCGEHAEKKTESSTVTVTSPKADEGTASDANTVKSDADTSKEGMDTGAQQPAETVPTEEKKENTAQ